MSIQEFLQASHVKLPLQWTAVEQKQENVQQSEAASTPSLKTTEKSFILFAMIFYGLIVIKNSWLGDDSFITLRTVDNFLHGYGLTWNTDERVQAYTHPLWMFMLSAVTFVVHRPYIAALLLGFGVSFLAVALFAFRLAQSPLLAIAGVLCLTASKAFVDYSTSGLENPMTHLLIVAFALVFYQYRQHKHYVLWLSLLGMLMTLNRMDTVLLFVPALLYALWERRSWETLRTMALAFIPVVMWELFSLFYYGALFPNTAYAKLNTSISSLSLIKQGLGYLVSSFTFDPILLVIMLIAVCMVWLVKDWRSIPLVLGMGLYLAYIVRIGGDFMAGRFLTPPFIMAVILLVHTIRPGLNLNVAFLLALALFFGFVTPFTRWSFDPVVLYGSGTAWHYDARFYDDRGITDERYFYASAVNIFRIKRGRSFPDYALAQSGLQARLNGDRVSVVSAIGMFGYEAGPKVHVVDQFALADPLLARLPVVGDQWSAGQFVRPMPDGYIETFTVGANTITDPDLAKYYDKLHLVISGPLFSWDRIVAIWNLNTGGYNSLLQHYEQRYNAAHHITSTLPGHSSGALLFSKSSELLKRRCWL